jgi:Ca2+-binding EF-hand superfamily protein
MTRKQFVGMYKNLCPKGDAERFARHVFRAFDTDKSNTVDFHEFLVGLSMTSPTSSTQTKLEWTFHVFDIDGNGILTRRECLEVIESIVRFNQSLQGDHLNPNSDQIILSAKRSMMKIFDNVQDRRTDKLTMSQFVEGCLKDEFISQLLAPQNGPSLTNTQNGPSLTNTQNTCDSPVTNS